MFSRPLCSVAFLVAFIYICDSKLDPLPDCPQRNCTCDPNDSSVNDAYDKYTVVIDAGSTHTSAYLYGMSPTKLPQLMEVGKAVCDNWPCPIVDYAQDTQGLKNYLKPIIHKVSLQVPPCKLCQTPIFLGATVGVRLLDKINESASNELIEEVQKILNNSGFCYKSGNAAILKGSEEAGLTWVAANSICGSGHDKTKGALNLGGGSSEIAFECRDECGNFSSTDNAEILLYEDHNVFSQCNDCYGLTEAMHRFMVVIIWQNYFLNGGMIKNPIENPCLKYDLNSNKTDYLPTNKSGIFKGYCTEPKILADPDFKQYINTLNDDYEFDFVGKRNDEKCSRAIETLLGDRCKQIFLESCFDKPIQGLWDNSDGFIAMGANHFSHLLKQKNTTTIKDVNKEIERICMEETDGRDTDCFAVTYTFEMLTTGYGFDEEGFTKVEFNNTVDWPYGYAVINNNNKKIRSKQNSKFNNNLGTVQKKNF